MTCRRSGGVTGFRESSPSVCIISYLTGSGKPFSRFEADRSAVDIREQFPLDRRQTYRVAQDLGFKHPVTTSGTPYVLTIDFLITRRIRDNYRLEPYRFTGSNTKTV